jgi:hypothetical protein
MTPEQIKVIYSTVSRLTIDLHSDPSSLGPKYLQDVTATCNNYKNEVSGILIQLLQQKHLVTRELQTRLSAYQVSFDDLLANNQHVSRLPNIEDRKATANVMLREDRQAIARLEAEQKDLESMEKVVRHRHKELSDTMAAVKVQRSLIRDELDTKSFYGDERINKLPGSGGGSSSPLGGDDVNEEELLLLLEGDTAKAVEPEADEPEPVVVVPTTNRSPVLPSVTATETSDEQAIQNFLGASPAIVTEDDYEDVFSGL